jgi:hypothetical protein
MNHTFDAELSALKTIYETLRPFPIHERDRIVRMVQERLARERAGGGPLVRHVNVDLVAVADNRKR